MNITSLPTFPQTPYSSPRAKSASCEQENHTAAKQSTQALLSESEKQQVKKLQQRDREVRNHEQAHKNSAGAYAKGINYDLQRGPDGVAYAVGGEVAIDTSPIAGDPHATLEKAQTILNAALAPAEPSSQDYAVAAQARQLAMQAKSDIVVMRQSDDKTTSASAEQAIDHYVKTANNDGENEKLGSNLDLFL